MQAVSEILKRHGPSVGLIDNPTQREYAAFVASGIEAARQGGPGRPGGQLFAEAETGSGKTIGYLVAAGMDCVTHGSRAVIATHTLALQRQIISRDADGQISEGCDMARALRIIEMQTGRKLQAALRIGRRNFVDSERTQKLIDRLLKRDGLPEQTQLDLQALAEWAQAHPGHEIREFLESEGLDALPAGLSMEDLCVGPDSPRDGASWLEYKRHTEDALAADIVVTNHALLVRQALASGQPILTRADDSRQLGVVVVDECDQMESAARNATSDLLPLVQMRAAIDRWSQSRDGVVGIRATEAAIALSDLMTDLREVLLPDVPSGAEAIAIWDDIPQRVRNQVLRALQDLGTALSPLMSTAPTPDDEAEADVREYAQTLANFWRNIKGMANVDGRSSSVAALRWSPDRRYPSLRLFRLKPARVLKRVWDTWSQPTGNDGGEDQDSASPQDELFPQVAPSRPEDPRKARALILTSATISAPTRHGKLDTTQMSDVFGVWPATNACDGLNQESRAFAPKRFGSVDIVFSDPAGPTVYLESEEHDDTGERQKVINPQWLDYITQIVKAANARRGRILVLANSYRTTEMIATALRRAGLDPIEKTRTTAQGACVRRLLAQPDGIFVTPGSWEGFDTSRFSGPDGQPAKIKHVVMTQLPFSRVDDAFGAAMKRHLTTNRGMSADDAMGVLYGQTLAAALRKARQGFGRGIRGPGDSFTLWIGDIRFPRPSHFNARKRTPGVRTMQPFANIIPMRFRDSMTGDTSAWGLGRMVTRDGHLIEAPVDEMA